MNATPYIVCAIGLLGLVLWLWWRDVRLRHELVPPYHPGSMVRFDLEAATRFANDALAPDTHVYTFDDLRRMIEWCAEYVRSNARPLNGNSPAELQGWLVPPNPYDTVRHVRERAREHGWDLDTAFTWRLVNTYDDYLRTLS